jgi:hypothetical protein
MSISMASESTGIAGKDWPEDIVKGKKLSRLVRKSVEETLNRV